ncbi:hypothetical protein AB0B04_19575 [Streptomyces xinghaiensis]|uniref:Uncharacterized protein n=2 Tax=Streptomyces TaxID=1883 RepID=A0A3M8EYF2_9ACTN|nr:MULTISPECIES: hypothetical protein [Streptomyces]KNE83376.1 hypothetical protein ADZ36_06055 [Streptomyces fradiae]OFA37590.1 hypothetical protein BEN35_28935 [Streptomyces fradiae]PQM20533.1 hypothetical protein Sfr7A_25355 [Streptomyces xinghaiensis]RKM92475.1 hypothetical protein SFRA_024010 [Streptomyces xinghaiensis]RNC70442.1 hypothetical protein DC095_025000 [Streptomyces xinghaiensis]
MTRPLSSAEMSAQKRLEWLQGEERKAVESRGEKGRMEFWLRLTRSRITKDIKAGRSDVYSGFTQVCRLFMLAMDKRAAGDARLWNQLMQYAQQVLEQNPPRH